jgi:hypothetical protein
MSRRLVRVVELVALATLAAGVVGALRQRTEAREVRSGARAPATAAAQLPPARASGGLGEALAAWVPTRPVTPLGRVVAAAWTAPLTAVGFGLALAAGRLPRWDAEHGVFVAAGMRGPSALALQTVGADANTIGLVVLARVPALTPALLAHEAVHARQAERLGPLLLPVYAWLGARYGYRDHPLERAARLGAHRRTGASR